MKVEKWGDSLAVRLPASVVEALDLKEGDSIDIQVAGTRAVDVAMTPDVRALLVRLRRFRRSFPPGFKFDRLEANERG